MEALDLKEALKEEEEQELGLTMINQGILEKWIIRLVVVLIIKPYLNNEFITNFLIEDITLYCKIRICGNEQSYEKKKVEWLWISYWTILL